jgi:hypothetical protein
MERVVKTRQAGGTARSLPAVLPFVDGFLAVEDCDEIGTILSVEIQQRHETFLVADCSGSVETSRWMQGNNIIGEIDGATAKRWQVVGRATPRITFCPQQLVGEIAHHRENRIQGFISRATWNDAYISLLSRRYDFNLYAEQAHTK